MLSQIARKINEGIAAKSKMKIGKIVKHPDGRRVKVVSGNFLVGGRVSNFWCWREVFVNGRLGEKESGYGW